ncbi:Enhances serine sensitivity [Photorhabdus temperata]|uniref:SseB protein n=2 Tax=Photorhabdus khanii TaxID=1004150 RepID=W3VCH9_9GAMM|nr:SseB protein [Photorhabdus khanii NC19]MQL47673.1 enhanced serine sensitivity protein SseB [Photorhabdus khanii]OHV52957.1 Enhances serine sensitivity [Photorhabdus temperata]
MSSLSELVSVEVDVPSGSAITLSQPEEYPSQLIEALVSLFSQRKPVRRAFIIQAHDKNVDEKPNLLIGLEMNGTENEIEQLIQEAGGIACEYTSEEEPIDFCLVDEKERGISHYLIQHTQPFYQRKLGSWLRGNIPVMNK